jgi:hypothetical protein
MMPWSKAMAYPTMACPTPTGISEAAVGSGMAGIQFILAVQMELLKEYEEVSRAWMSEVKLWSTLAVKLSTSASVRIAARCLQWRRACLLPPAQSRTSQPAPSAELVQQALKRIADSKKLIARTDVLLRRR